MKFLSTLIARITEAVKKTVEEFGINADAEMLTIPIVPPFFVSHCYLGGDWVGNCQKYRGYEGRSLADTPEARAQVDARVKGNMGNPTLAGIPADGRFCLLSENDEALGLPPAFGVLATVAPYDGRYDGMNAQAILDKKNAQFFNGTGPSGGSGTEG